MYNFKGYQERCKTSFIERGQDMQRQSPLKTYTILNLEIIS